MNRKSIGVDALEILKTCDKVYLENYTVDFPYPIIELEKEYNIKIIELARKSVEDELILEEAKDKNIALLVYGDSLSATTHTQLLLAAKKQKVDFRVFHNASILTVIAETGLQLYKFGKTASMPNWEEHTNKPTSFMDYIKQNQSIDAHTLILTDIGLEIKEAITQLLESSKQTKITIPKEIIAISSAGTPEQQIFYNTPNELKDKNIPMPFCLIIPTKLHFIEEEALKEFKE